MTIYTRILQQIGSSILISLPNEWIKRNQLSKGKVVSIEINNDNTISIYNIDSSEEIKIDFVYQSNRFINNNDLAGAKQYETSPDNIEKSERKTSGDIKNLLNKIYGAYLLGFNIINIKSKYQISYDDSEILKKSIRKLIGLEIVDEDSYNINLQFLLDANTLNIEKILNMMNSIISGMFKETIYSLDGKFTEDLKKKISSRDDEIDRQYFLIVRLIRTAIMNKKLAKNLNLSNIDMLDYRIAANYLETAGDLITELISYFTDINKDKQISDLIKKSGNFIEEMQIFSIDAFTSVSGYKASKVMENYEGFKTSLSELKKLITINKDLTISDSSLISIVNIISCLDKIAKCWVDITDLAKPTYMIK